MSHTLVASAPRTSPSPDRPAARRHPLAVAPALLTALAVVLVHPLAMVVSHFHVSTGTAGMIIAAITGGSAWILSAFFPWVLPYVLTIRGIIAVAGTGVAVGW